MGVKFSIDENFFDHWTQESAYVLGYLYADGSLEDSPAMRGKYVRVASTDRDRIEVFKRLLKSEHTIVKEKVSGNRKPRYLLRIGNKRLFEQLIALGLTPRKSLTMKFPHIPAPYVSSFIRGYFDGDGCVFLQNGIGKNGQKIIKRLSVIFTSGSDEFLEELKKILQKRALMQGGGIYNTTRARQLWFFTKDSRKLFAFLYKDVLGKDLYMQRKYVIFDEYFERRPSVVTAEIRTIQNRLGGEVVTLESAKLPRAGSIPARASREHSTSLKIS